MVWRGIFICLLLAAPAQAQTQTALETSVRPSARPAVLPVQLKGAELCGVPDIRGRRLAPIQGKWAGCQIAAPLAVNSVAGVTLSQAATIDCTTAKALRAWVVDGVMPILNGFGGGVSELQVAAHYVCRTRNNKPDGKLSEHAKGHAIDISAIHLKSGDRLSVLSDWDHPRRGKYLKAMHKAACGPFGTVLGPNADVYHKDHFHFDTARYRAGPYCR